MVKDHRKIFFFNHSLRRNTDKRDLPTSRRNLVRRDQDPPGNDGGDDGRDDGRDDSGDDSGDDDEQDGSDEEWDDPPEDINIRNNPLAM